jgi:hypothetical protein
MLWLLMLFVLHGRCGTAVGKQAELITDSLRLFVGGK